MRPMHLSIAGMLIGTATHALHESVHDAYKDEAAHTRAKLRKRRFVQVWKQNLWSSAESRSGRGSERRHAKPDRVFLLDLIRKRVALTPKTANLTIVDFPCGDMNWMVELLETLEGEYASVTYHGYDIVPDAIAQHRKRFGRIKPLWHFYHADAVSTVPVRGDLLLCRDLLNHLSLEDGRRVLSNVLMSRTPLLAISNNQRDVRRNEPLVVDDGGSSREIDITKPPFGWPRPIQGNGHLFVWNLRNAVARGPR